MKHQTFLSRILGVGCRYDIGDNVGGLCCLEGDAVNRQVECGTDISRVELELDRGSTNNFCSKVIFILIQL